MASPTIHLMWKEYRALRSLWLGILALAAALSLLQIMNFTIIVSGNWALSDIATGATFVGIVTASLFAIVSICIAFAGEAEDRTTLLLQQLAPTWRQLMCGKLSAIALGTAALPPIIVLANGLMLLVMYLIVPAQFATGKFSITPDPSIRMAPWTALGATQVLTIAAAVFGGGCLIAVPSLCWSLVSRKVITATLAAIFSVLFLYPLTIILFQNYGGISGTLMWMFLSGVAVLLSLMWHRGYLPPRAEPTATPDSGILRRKLPGTLTLIATIGLIWLIVDWLARHQVSWTPVAAVVAGVLLVGGLTILWLQCSQVTSMRAWLIRSSALPPSAWRMTRMLLWKEAHHAAEFLISWTIIGVVVIQLCIQAQSDVIFIAAGPAILFMAVFCQECGLRTLRREAADGTTLFLAHRGITASTVWWTKIGFWATVMTLVMTLWLYADYASLRNYAFYQLSGFNAFDFSNLGNALSVTHLLLMLSLRAAGPWTETYPQRALEIALLFAACCFVSGVVAAGCLRRPILSFAFASSLSILLLLSMGFLLGVDVPFPVTVWPLLLVWLAISRLTARQSYEQRNSWRLDAGRIFLMTVTAFLVVLSARQARVNAIPDSTTIHILDNAKMFGEPVMSYLHHDTAGTAKTEPLDAYPSGNTWVRLYRAFISLSDSAAAVSQPAIDTFAELRHLTHSEVLASVPRSWKSPWAPSLTPAVVSTAVQHSRQLTAQGQHTEALSLLTDALRIVQSLNDLNCSRPQLHEYLRSKQVLLRELSVCAADDSINVEDLQNTRKLLVQYMSHDQEMLTMLRNRFYFFWLSEDPFRFEDPAPSSVDESVSIWNEQREKWQSVPRTERKRFLKLLRAATEIQISRHEGTEPPGSDLRMADLLRHSATTVDFDIDIKMELQQEWNTHQDLPLYRLLTDTVAAERATLLIFELQGYRRQHGKFPDSLETLRQAFELSSQQFERITQRPWTKTLFGYAPSGPGMEILIFDLDSSTYRRELLPADQPMLWSTPEPAAVDRASRELFARQPPEADRQQSTTNPDAPPSPLNRFRVPLRPNQILLQW